MSDYEARTAELLGFTRRWWDLGVIDATSLALYRAEWDRGEDRNPEHYRYGAFRAFLAARRPLPPDLAQALFELGDADPDQMMGGAMMADIVRLPECPKPVLDLASSSRPHLVRLVERRSPGT